MLTSVSKAFMIILLLASPLYAGINTAAMPGHAWHNGLGTGVSPLVEYYPEDRDGRLGGSILKVSPLIRDTAVLGELIRENGEWLAETYSATYGVEVDSPAFAILLQVDDNVDPEEIDHVASSWGGRLASYHPEVGLAVVVLGGADASRVYSLSSALAAFDSVEGVYPDLPGRLLMWDAAETYGLGSLWDGLGYTGNGTTILVLDTGVDTGNPAIPEPVYWRDYVGGLEEPYDDNGHGTLVSGVAAGRGYSVFGEGDGLWHSMILGEGWGGVDLANLTYAVDLPSGAETVAVELRHLYTLYFMLRPGFYYQANATIYYRFDDGNWTLLALFEGNQTTPTVDVFNITVPANSSRLEVSFIYDYIYKRMGDIIISYKVINGWYIDYVRVYDASTNETILYDPVNDTSPPASVEERSYWVRVKDEFRGAAPGASLAVGKVCNSYGGCSMAVVAEAMLWALEIGADVVSMSLAWSGDAYFPIGTIADYLYENGVVVVAGAGNSGPLYYTVGIPAGARGAIAVGATTKVDTIAGFSSAGPSMQGLVKPDVLAAGYGVSTTARIETAPWPDFPFVSASGTSISAPLVAGVAALLLEAHPGWGPREVKSALISTGDWPMEDAGLLTYRYNIYRVGGGVVDPVDAVSMKVLPVEANLRLGLLPAGVSAWVNASIVLENLGDTSVEVHVVDVNFYSPNTSIMYSPDEVIEYDDRVGSPLNGSVYTVEPGGAVEIPLALDVSGLEDGVYGGHIEFYAEGIVFHVIYGFKLYTPAYINGFVIDYETGEPIEGAVVRLYTYGMWPPLAGGDVGPVSETVSGPDGSFSLPFDPESPGSYRVSAEMPGYYAYIGGQIYVWGDNMTVNISMVERKPGAVLVVLDKNRLPTPAESEVVDVFTTAINETGLQALVWDMAALGSIYSPLESGDFPVTVYLGLGSMSPLYDPIDRKALLDYALDPGHTLIVSSSQLAYTLDPGMDPIAGDLRAIGLHVEDVEVDWGTGSPVRMNLTIVKRPPLAVLGGAEAYSSAEPGEPVATVEITFSSESLESRIMLTPTPDAYPLLLWDDGSVASIVYPGGEHARTVYLAFEFWDFDNETMLAVASKLLLYAVDREPPSVAYGAYALYWSEGLLYGSIGEGVVDDQGIEFYSYRAYVEGWNVAVATGWSLDGSVEIGMEAFEHVTGLTYVVEVAAVDHVGQEAGIRFKFNYMGEPAGVVIAVSSPEEWTGAYEIPGADVTLELVVAGNTSLWASLGILEPGTLPPPPELDGFEAGSPVMAYHLFVDTNNSNVSIVVASIYNGSQGDGVVIPYMLAGFRWANATVDAIVDEGLVVAEHSLSTSSDIVVLIQEYLAVSQDNGTGETPPDTLCNCTCNDTSGDALPEDNQTCECAGEDGGEPPSTPPEQPMEECTGQQDSGDDALEGTVPGVSGGECEEYSEGYSLGSVAAVAMAAVVVSVFTVYLLLSRGRRIGSSQ